ncbi:hypothetical protein H7F50_15020 [Novosphingobium flavum]|uniref:Uncharacterized protein n=1 Tax=Novosphingobium aerophilum TaxID=2839843 RepID=A0A7X1F9I4_9SPHN|nr:TorF family putative porin [Novosphingobium aerophilum]MBC2652900.1 hypothetical protein [Novosphingobium aerophilum]MBC2663063.1 hypothetical protein [Novosphingobium aerophilum]
MHHTIKAALAATVLSATLTAVPAFADEASPVTITGSATLTSEYRLRGISQTDRDLAVQAGITVSHASGFYIGTWGSNLSGAGTFGGDNMELDLLAGYTKAVGGVTVDGGLIYYVYPGANIPGTSFDYYELYGSVSGKVGPANAKVGAFWAPSQKDIAVAPKAKGHNIWVYTDWGLPVSGTPVTVKAHLGYSSGDSGYTKGLDVIDYGVGADFAYKNLTLNLSYIGTDVSKANSLRWGNGRATGHDITKGGLVATLSAAF